MNNTNWWGATTFDNLQTRQWSIGPLTLYVRRLPAEWQIAYERGEPTGDNQMSWQSAAVNAIPENLTTLSRYVFAETSGLFNITPMLADRAVISRPVSPFHVTAGEEVTLYVSSPAWLELSVGGTKKTLCEIASQRPSDTWFGPSTREGELCYASSTHCRHNLTELPLRSHRVITPVIVRNLVDNTLTLERLSLPVPLLQLYATNSGQLWTPKITLTREEEDELATLKIDHKAPQEAKDAELINKPRKNESETALIRAFNAVFK